MALTKIGTDSIKDNAVTSAKIPANAVTQSEVNFPVANRNLIINGAMQVAQRGTSATGVAANTYATVDRFHALQSGTDEYIEQHQVDVASGTTPYTLGFRKAFQVKNGNQSNGAGSGDYITMRYKIEAQDIANSGWNYIDTNSFVTLTFWVKSSIAQNFYGYLKTVDGTAQLLPFETGSLTQNQWTKVTKTISGNSNLQFDNNNDIGLELYISQYWGASKTESGKTLDAWANYNGASRVPDMSATWYTTNDATFEITGVQLEVGSVATDFEHLSHGDTLAKCQRYFYMHASGAEASANNRAPIATGAMYSSGNWNGVVNFPVKMRTSPSLYKVQGTDYFIIFGDGGNNTCSSAGIDTTCPQSGTINLSNGLAQTSGTSHWGVINNDLARLGFQAEL